MSAIHLSHVSFSYSSAVPVITDATFDLGPGWAGLVGANGAGKSTLLSFITGEHPPDSGTVSVEPVGFPPVLCDQRVDELTIDIQDFGWDWDGDAVRMRARLDLDPGQLERWPTLSPGERKRWQIGAALTARPDVLLLDEPTNHLDAEVRGLVVSALEDFRGCGVLVSHDRDLLNSLTTKTVRVLPGRVETWNGSYDSAHEAWVTAAVEQADKYGKLKANQRNLARRLDQQHRKTAHKDAARMRIRRSAPKKDHDARGAVAKGTHNRGQKTGATEVATISNTLQSVAGKIEGIQLDQDLGGPIGFGFEPSNKEFLIRYDGHVMAGQKHLFTVDVAIRRTDRIRIAGSNGAGKTLLLRELVDAASIPPDKILYLAQETTSSKARTWLNEVNSLPAVDRGRVMTLVARLGADPGTLLQSHQPSPGEARKIALAVGLGTPKWLLVLDEPTNHLDLPSIERLESALNAYEGAILLITHDDGLAGRTTQTTWTVTDAGLTM
jgi:ATPase subunit of ABC transporter with duplicated ATPase domains